MYDTNILQIARGTSLGEIEGSLSDVNGAFREEREKSENNTWYHARYCIF